MRNIIAAYLDNLFNSYPQTPRLLEAKEELRAMMEDAYNSLREEGDSENEAVGKVIRDFGNLEDIAPILGINAEVHPQQAGSADRDSDAGPANHQYPVISLEQAQGYSGVCKSTRYRSSTSVGLFILSPAVLIFLPSLLEQTLGPSATNVGTFIGLLVLIVLVAIGLVLRISLHRELKPFQSIHDGEFFPNPLVTQWASKIASWQEPQRHRGLQIAITLWVLATFPLLAGALIMPSTGDADGGLWTLGGVVASLALVAGGCWVFLPRIWAHAVYETLSTGNTNAAEERANEEEYDALTSFVASVYWPVVLAIYLVWSFVFEAWNSSWIIWPVAGALFAVVLAVTHGIAQIASSRR